MILRTAEKEIEDFNRIVTEKHVTFQRLGSQSRSTQDLALEFDKMIESSGNSPGFDSSQNSPFSDGAENSEGGGGRDGHATAEQEGVGQNNQLVGGSTPKRPHSPGESPNKKTIILPENGRQIWIKNKEGIRQGCILNKFVNFLSPLKDALF